MSELFQFLCFSIGLFCAHPKPIEPSDDKSDTIQRFIYDLIPEKSAVFRRENRNIRAGLCEIPYDFSHHQYITYIDGEEWSSENKDLAKYRIMPIKLVFASTSMTSGHSEIHPRIVKQCNISIQNLKTVVKKYQNDGIIDDMEYADIYHVYLGERQKVIDLIEQEKLKIDREIKYIKENGSRAIDKTEPPPPPPPPF